MVSGVRFLEVSCMRVTMDFFFSIWTSLVKRCLFSSFISASLSTKKRLHSDLITYKPHDTVSYPDFDSIFYRIWSCSLGSSADLADWATAVLAQ